MDFFKPILEFHRIVSEVYCDTEGETHELDTGIDESERSGTFKNGRQLVTK